MKKFSFIVLAAAFPFVVAASPIVDALDAYLNNPTEFNAKRAEETARQSRKSVDLGSTDLRLIRNQVVAGSGASLRLVLALLTNADGGALEDLMALAAAAIRPQPELFLHTISRENLSNNSLTAILLMPGEEYVDRPQAREFELLMRERAIAGVTQKDLEPIKRKCLAILRARDSL